MTLEDESAVDGAEEGGRVNPKAFDRKAKQLVQNFSRTIEALPQDTESLSDSGHDRGHQLRFSVIHFLENVSALTTVTSKAALADFRRYMRRVPQSLASALRAWMPKVEYAWEQADEKMSGTMIRVRQTRGNCAEARMAQHNITEIQGWFDDLVLSLKYGTLKNLIPHIKIAINDLLPGAKASKIAHTVVQMGDSTLKIASSMNRGMLKIARSFTSVLDNKLNCSAE